MATIKKYREQNVLDAARERVSYAFDSFERIYVSFSGGKDSSVMMHLVLQEAIKRNRKVGVLILDLEAQYKATEDHIREMVAMYKDNIDLYWLCLPLLLRNALTNYEPRWMCWEPGREDAWVRTIPPEAISDGSMFDFYEPAMEFEEFAVLFGAWYGQGKPTGGFVGIRADESLNRFRTIAVSDKRMHGGKRFTTQVVDEVYNVYPLYDWRTQDIWRFHSKYPDKPHNRIYDLMHKAMVPLSQQRLCQPYGDDQRRGLWLYHILEPETWSKVVARVNGANGGALYIQETGNVTGYNKSPSLTAILGNLFLTCCYSPSQRKPETII